MKRVVICLLALCLLTLWGCGAEEPAETVQETAVPVTKATAPAAEETVPATEETGTCVVICRDDFPVYAEPGYDWSPSGTVGATREHAVVETWEDEEGNLWGRLAAGGWVDLTRNEAQTENMPPITVCRGEHYRRYDGLCHYCQASTSEYAYLIAISAQEPLRNVSFFSIVYDQEARRGPELLFLEEWNPDIPLVVNGEFVGAASMYGLEFTDSEGETMVYSLWESGRNGYVEVSPFTEPLAP